MFLKQDMWLFLPDVMAVAIFSVEMWGWGREDRVQLVAEIVDRSLASSSPTKVDADKRNGLVAWGEMGLSLHRLNASVRTCSLVSLVGVLAISTNVGVVLGIVWLLLFTFLPPRHWSQGSGARKSVRVKRFLIGAFFAYVLLSIIVKTVQIVIAAP